MLPAASDVVLFDGDCALCNATVRFIIDRDPAGRFRFAPQQSPAGRRLLTQYQSSAQLEKSVVLIEGSGRVSIRSEAVLRICKNLRWPWPLLSLGLLLPRVLLDLVYRAVARVRYRVFGRVDACRLPTPEMRARLLS